MNTDKIFDLLRSYIDFIELMYKYLNEDNKRREIITSHYSACVAELGTDLINELKNNEQSKNIVAKLNNVLNQGEMTDDNFIDMILKNIQECMDKCSAKNDTNSDFNTLDLVSE